MAVQACSAEGPRGRDLDRERVAGSTHRAQRLNVARSPETPTPSPLDAQIEEQRTRLAQLRVHQQRIESRLRFLSARRSRREETRRQILIGRVILDKIEHGGFDEKLLRVLLDEALTREEDRRLFALGKTRRRATE